MHQEELLALYRDAIKLSDVSDVSVIKKFKNVTFMDQGSIFISSLYDISIGKGSVIGSNVYLLGRIEIGENTIIGPGMELINVSIGDRCMIGRAPIVDVVMGNDVIVGKFTEIVRTKIDDKAHAVHASYLGDSHVCEDANIAYGTTTANYDGTPIKNRTIFGPGAKTGVHSLFIPSKGKDKNIPGLLVVGENAIIGAGAIIKKDVPSGATVVGLDRIIKIEEKKNG